MGRWKKKSPEAKMRTELKNRFQQQEQLTLQEVTEEYFEPKSPYAFVIATRKMRAIFGSVKRELAKDRIPFGCINERGVWGIPRLKEEYEFMGIKRYKLVKGIIRGTKMILSSGVRQGLIKARSQDEVIMVPVLEGNAKKGSDK